MNTAMIKLILITVLVLVGVGGMFYVSNMQANLAVAKENQAKLEQAVVAQQEALSTMKADVAKQQVINQQLAKATEDQNKDMKDLEGKFKTEPLQVLLQDDHKFGFVIVDGNGCLFANL
jgi:flagellar basal body-associated protein FliL